GLCRRRLGPDFRRGAGRVGRKRDRRPRFRRRRRVDARLVGELPEHESKQPTAMVVDHVLDTIDRVRKLAAELGGLLVNGRREPGAEAEKNSEKCEDDEWRAESARDVPAAKQVDAGGDRKTEQDAEERSEKQRV